MSIKYVVCAICGSRSSKIQKTIYCLRCRRILRRYGTSALKLSCVQYLGGKCLGCGNVATLEDIDDFHFDHVDGKKNKQNIISTLLCNVWFAPNPVNIAKLIDELDKCRPLHSYCHKVSHSKWLRDVEELKQTPAGQQLLHSLAAVAHAQAGTVRAALLTRLTQREQSFLEAQTGDGNDPVVEEHVSKTCTG